MDDKFKLCALFSLFNANLLNIVVMIWCGKLFNNYFLIDY
jgi:hypothetical protein